MLDCQSLQTNFGGENGPIFEQAADDVLKNGDHFRHPEDDRLFDNTANFVPELRPWRCP